MADKKQCRIEKTFGGYQVSTISNGKKYYLSKTGKNLEFSLDYTYSRKFKTMRTAEKWRNVINYNNGFFDIEE